MATISHAPHAAAHWSKANKLQLNQMSRAELRKAETDVAASAKPSQRHKTFVEPLHTTKKHNLIDGAGHDRTLRSHQGRR